MKPMLSCNTLPQIDTQVPYPCLVSKKLDGIRGVVYEGNLASRTLKLIPNLHVQGTIQAVAHLLEGLDGELTLLHNPHDFNANQSAFMTHGGKPEFVFNVFDDRTHHTKLAERRKAETKHRVDALRSQHGLHFLRFCEQHIVRTPSMLRYMYSEARKEGYEGLIMMHPHRPYKFGRSTLLQQISLKLKPCNDAEATITGMEELMHNTDAGNSKKLANMVPGDTMGTLVGVNSKGIGVRCGTGFTAAQRQDFWDNFDKYKGKTFTYKYMETFKDTGAPRGAVFKGLRYE